MSGFLGALSPGRMAKLNLLGDLAVLVLAVAFASRGHGLFWSMLLAPVWILTAAALRHYDPWASDRSALDDLALVSVLVAAVTTVQAMLNALFGSWLPTPNVGHYALASFPLHAALRALIRGLRRLDKPLDEVLVVGTGPLGRLTREDVAHSRRRRVLGYLRFPDEPEPERSNAYLGVSDELESILRDVPVAEVYVAGNAIKQGPAMQRVVHTCERFGVPFALPAQPFRLDRAQAMGAGFSGDGYQHLLCCSYKPAQMAVKRLFDIVASAFALWVLLPFFAVVIAAIKLTSKGPIFFKQQRVGLNGKPFHMLKFRSMVVNAEALLAGLQAQNEQTGPVFKMRRDPRITRVGRFIRKYSIDELPQLINVLRGDMSIVGPRPPVPSEVARYEPWQRRRLSVRPGLTCIWQVSGRNQISFEEWMYLDMRYIDHWSLTQDLELIVRTVPVVLTGRGAS
ncbi:MAG: sugar transferase [Deltaproteobacteria bacterium]|nr:sugar transferase [Deltaproteobacteria bacterium]